MYLKPIYLIYFLFFPVIGHAYLDPGTGSLLIYAVVGVAASVVFALRNVWHLFLSLLFSGRSSVFLKEELPDLVFHSEGGKYWQVFEPVITAWISKGKKCAYITPDMNDPAFMAAKDNELLKIIRPGKEMLTISYLNKIKTKVLVSTTPGLDVYMWKRSKNVNRYVHLFHAPTSVAFYEKYALSFYDDILTVSPFHREEIDSLDQKRNLPGKKFYPTGVTYFDYMLREIKNHTRSRNEFTVLYAPTWGSRSSLTLYGSKIIDILVSENIPLIFRPHPQSEISDKQIMDIIREKYGSNPLVTFDRNRTGLVSMTNSDILITDFSGILYDYAFLFLKPIILTTDEAPVAGYEARDYKFIPWEIETARQLSYDLGGDPENIVKILEKIRTENKESSEEEIISFRDNNIYNYGKAGEAAANHLEVILGELE